IRIGPVGATVGAQTHSPGCRASAIRASSAGELTLAPWAYNGTLLAKAPARIATAHARNHLLASLGPVFISVPATPNLTHFHTKMSRLPAVLRRYRPAQRLSRG